MLGFDFEIVPMSFSSLVGSLQAKSVDMVISGMSYTGARADRRFLRRVLHRRRRLRNEGRF